jgi:hypothetical protein
VGIVLIRLRRACGPRRRSLAAIEDKLTSATLRWADIKRLILALLGGTVEERAGSRVRIVNGVGAVFNRPKPKPEARKGAVEAACQMPGNAGIKP